MQDAGVVPAGDGQLRVFSLDQIHRLLRLGDGGGGPDAYLELHRHPVGDAPVHPAGVVGPGLHCVSIHIKAVVGLAPPQGGKAHSVSEAHRLHRGHREEVLGEDALHVLPVVRRPQAGGQTGDGTADAPAYRVQLAPGLQHRLLILLRRGVRDARHVGDAGGHLDSLLLQQLLGHRPCKDQRRSEPAGEMASAPVVVAPLITHIAGVVPVSWAGQVLQLRVVPGTGVGICDHRAQRGARGPALKQAGEDLRHIRLLPGGGQGTSPRGPAGHLGGHPLQVQLQPRRHPLQHHTDGGAVGLSKDHISHASRSSLCRRTRPPRLS